MYANSRTLDIGKSCRPPLAHSLILERVWIYLLDLGYEDAVGCFDWDGPAFHGEVFFLVVNVEYGDAVAFVV